MIVLDGIYYALGLTVGGLLVSYLTNAWFGLPLYILAVFCLYFFRDPERVIPAGPVAVSPADGKVVAVKQEADNQVRISIFLNIFDVHVNRAPIGGAIADVQYRKGHFHVASREECSEENEQNVVSVRGDGTCVVFKQIAGLIARRIVFTKQPGDMVAKGERVGLIKFGSRVDVLFGPEWEVVVQPGMRVLAGSSVIARRGDFSGERIQAAQQPVQELAHASA
ncbi:MAG TPA: phosphatidylserine decarboxylase [Bryobacteraceae bacterium]|nr:phosphatidylserine decarboxylase [Bryobacteraceae bacterium]